MVRIATLRDVDVILGIARRFAKEQYPSLTFSENRTKTLLIEAISAAPHLVLVSEKDNRISGVLSGMTYDTLWAERQTAIILLFYAEIPGDGANMLRGFLRWTKTRRTIRQIEININADVDARLGKWLQRLGFSATDTVYRKFS